MHSIQIPFMWRLCPTSRRPLTQYSSLILTSDKYTAGRSFPRVLVPSCSDQLKQIIMSCIATFVLSSGSAIGNCEPPSVQFLPCWHSCPACTFWSWEFQPKRNTGFVFRPKRRVDQAELNLNAFEGLLDGNPPRAVEIGRAHV